MHSCTLRSPWTWLSVYPLSVLSTGRTRGSATFRLPPSGTGAAAAVVASITAEIVRLSCAGPTARGVTEERWTKRHMPTCWACTWATDTLLADDGAYLSCRSSAPMTGRDSSPLPRPRCAPSCPLQAYSASSDKDAPRSKAPQSTGHACCRNTGRVVSTLGKSSWNNGKSSSCRNTPVNLPGGYSIPTAGAASTGSGEGLSPGISGMRTRAMSLTTSQGTYSGCAVRPWTNSVWPGVFPGRPRYPWREVKRWRGLMSSSGPSTELARIRLRRCTGSGAVMLSRPTAPSRTVPACVSGARAGAEPQADVPRADAYRPPRVYHRVIRRTRLRRSMNYGQCGQGLPARRLPGI
jgi:hypothetical protein